MPLPRLDVSRIPATWALAALRAAGDFVYPLACPLCQRELTRATDGVASLRGTICDSCSRAISGDPALACVRCGAAIGPGLDPHRPCHFCRDDHFTFERVVRLGVYDGALRDACLAAKRMGGESLAAGLAELTWSANSATFAELGIDVVVPVPRHWVQRWIRPQHAAEVLGQVWAGRLKVPMAAHILRKVRWTKAQARLKPKQRRTNLVRAFAVSRKDAFSGASVLLADDVMTTGATAQEATRQLQKAGAARVVVAVVARGLGQR